ncbi:hypothetical protein [Cognaticolwellia aestuarii]|uniref:hypothetical protein n=1 Tax=Cognaticolwellia aestuarii TaxID=329993 RepID=UPI0009862E51|nr:hypothetical protein [Cognaticolwellia aestuarii]
MNLFVSILTSIIIVVIVWFGVIYQPSSTDIDIITSDQAHEIAKEITAGTSPFIAKKIKTNTDKNDVKYAVYNTPVRSVFGVEQHMKINDIEQLWSKFYRDQALQSKLNDYPTAAYVLYRNISKDFKNADITIGYHSDELSNKPTGVLLPVGYYQTVLTGNDITSIQLLKAWQKLDFSREVTAVIERHQLNKSADVTSVRMQVIYK